MHLSGLRTLATTLLVSLALAWAATAMLPRQFIATASVLLPGPRLLKFEHVSGDPGFAAHQVARQLEGQQGRVIDAPSVRPVRWHPYRSYGLAAALGLALGFALVLRRERQRRPVRSENDLVAALGTPLLAARPWRDTALRELCLQLLEHWFTRSQVLPVVSAARGEGRTRIAARLAQTFASMGVRTLLIDADLRSPGQHREFGLANRQGLADLLSQRAVQPAACGDNLAVLVAGSSSADPLELLSRPRLPELLAAAGKRFQVVLVDTPAAARGPDLQIFAALARGALVVAQRSRAEQAGLRFLASYLARGRARVVVTVLSDE